MPKQAHLSEATAQPERGVTGMGEKSALELISVHPDTPSGKPPLLFIHGTRHGAWAFAEHWLAAAAARGYPAHALSLPGHGRSPDAQRIHRYRVRDYTAAVMATAADLPEPPVLLGHSMGAYVVQQAIARGRAAAGVLLTPLGPWPAILPVLRIGRRYPQDLLALLSGRRLPLRHEELFPGIDRGLAGIYLSRLGAESRVVQYQFLLHRPAPRPPADFPVLVVGATDDVIIPPADVRLTARYYRTEPLMFPAIGHDVMLDAGWRRPLDAVLDWVDRHTRRHDAACGKPARAP